MSCLKLDLTTVKVKVQKEYRGMQHSTQQDMLGQTLTMKMKAEAMMQDHAMQNRSQHRHPQQVMKFQALHENQLQMEGLERWKAQSWTVEVALP